MKVFKARNSTIATALVLVLSAGIVFSLTEVETGVKGSYDIDPGHSSIIWSIKHMGVSYLIGRFNNFTGSYQLDTKKPENIKINITIKADSIDSNSPNRDKHLKNKDFFDTPNHAEIKFISTSAKKGKKHNEFLVTGDLTLLGKTRQVEIPVQFIGQSKPGKNGKHKSGGKAVFTIKRSDFGMSYGIGNIGDEVEITAGIEGNSK